MYPVEPSAIRKFLGNLFLFSSPYDYHRVVIAAGEERRRLIEAHLPLARRVARRYAGRGERPDDLAQVGALALVRAVDRCDPSRVELPAYLARCVEGEIRHHLRDRAATVRLPAALAADAARELPLGDEIASPDAGARRRPARPCGGRERRARARRPRAVDRAAPLLLRLHPVRCGRAARPLAGACLAAARRGDREDAPPAPGPRFVTTGTSRYSQGR